MSLGREFLVTFVGLLLALIVNSWWQERQERRAEIQTLGEIRSDLRTDSADVAINLWSLTKAVAAVSALTVRVDQRQPYVPAVDSMLAVLGGWVDHQHNAAGYETLKSRGIRLVTNDSLRRAIAQFYETKYGEEEQLDRINALALDRIGSVVHRYVRQPSYFAPAHPINYQTMINDPAFRAFLDESSARNSATIGFEKSLKTDVAALSNAIDQELARRK